LLVQTLSSAVGAYLVGTWCGDSGLASSENHLACVHQKWSADPNDKSEMGVTGNSLQNRHSAPAETEMLW